MLSAIVAFDKNRLIGKNNTLPWHYSEDLKYFKNITLNHKLIMGYNTYLSILDVLKKPFPNRHNIVLCENDFSHEFDNLELTNNIECLIEKYKSCDEEVFVAGGMSIYKQLLEHCNKLYITHIDEEHEGDAHFPEINYDEFKLISKSESGVLSFCVYERIDYV